MAGKGSSAKKATKLVALAVSTMLIAIILLISIHYPEKSPMQSEGIIDGRNQYGDGGLLGARVENATGGNWTFTVIGSIGIKGADLVVRDLNGVCLRAPLSLYETEDFKLENKFADREGSLKLFNDGDFILLKCTSPHLKSGDKITIYRGDRVLLGWYSLP
jgi:hypothetical protein